MTDEELMRLAASGDTGAFEELFERYADRLVGFCYRYLGERAAAEDAAQATWVKVYRARCRYDGRAAFAPWLYRIAARTCIDVIRRRKHAAGRAATAQRQAARRKPHPPPADRRTLEHERREVVRAALAMLPEKQRVPLILRHWEGLDYKSIARVCSCSVGTVKSRVHYALAALRKNLEEMGYFDEEANPRPPGADRSGSAEGNG